MLTAGSPVGGIRPGPGIRSLHLEHEQDWVPGADGLANPDTRDRVTVTLTNPLAMPPLQDFGLGPGLGWQNTRTAPRSSRRAGTTHCRTPQPRSPPWWDRRGGHGDPVLAPA